MTPVEEKRANMEMSEKDKPWYTICVVMDVEAPDPKEALERFLKSLKDPEELEELVFTVYRFDENEGDPVAEAILNLPAGAVWQFIGSEAT